MKLIESSHGMIPLNERFIAVMLKPNEFPQFFKENYVKSSFVYRIFDTKTLEYLPICCSGVSEVKGGVGVVTDLHGNDHILYVNKAGDVEITSEKLAKCTMLNAELGVVSESKKSHYFISFKDGKFKQISPKFQKILEPVGKIAAVQLQDDMWTYANFDKDNNLTVLPERFSYVQPFVEGYGRVQDENGLWHYCTFNNNKLFQFPQGYKNISTVKGGVGRIECDLKGMKYCFLDGNQLVEDDRIFLYCGEIKNDIAPVFYEQNNKVKINYLYKNRVGLHQIKLPANFRNEKLIKPNAFNGKTAIVKDDKSDDLYLAFFQDGRKLAIDYEKFHNIEVSEDGKYALLTKKNGKSCYALLGDETIWVKSEEFDGRLGMIQDGVGVVSRPNYDEFVVFNQGEFKAQPTDLKFKALRTAKYGFRVVLTPSGKFNVFDKNLLPLVEKSSLPEALKKDERYRSYLVSSSSKPTTIDKFME